MEANQRQLFAPFLNVAGSAADYLREMQQEDRTDQIVSRRLQCLFNRSVSDFLGGLREEAKSSKLETC